MSVNIVFKNELDKQLMKDAYTETMYKLLKADPDVVTFDGDLMGAVGLAKYIPEFPDRILNLGIQEANIIGMAAGMSNLGKKPYVHTFAAFATRRVFDQIFISSAYGKNPIKIIGTDPGIYAKYNGGTHMPFEDVGMMRTIPNGLVLEATDHTMFCQLLELIKDYQGVAYIRAERSAVPQIYGEGSKFEIGKGVVLREGGDVTIIAGGALVSEALLAADQLEKDGVSATVIDMFSIKPIDKDLIVKYAGKTGAVVTAENHNVNSGLGDAVASVLGEYCPTPLKKVAVNDEFGEVGSLDYLKDRFGLNAAGIIKAVGEVSARKK